MSVRFGNCNFSAAIVVVSSAKISSDLFTYFKLLSLSVCLTVLVISLILPGLNDLCLLLIFSSFLKSKFSIIRASPSVGDSYVLSLIWAC